MEENRVGQNMYILTQVPLYDLYKPEGKHTIVQSIGNGNKYTTRTIVQPMGHGVECGCVSVECGCVSHRGNFFCSI